MAISLFGGSLLPQHLLTGKGRAGAGPQLCPCEGTGSGERHALAEIGRLLFVEPAYCLVCGLASPVTVP